MMTKGGAEIGVRGAALGDGLPDLPVQCRDVGRRAFRPGDRQGFPGPVRAP